MPPSGASEASVLLSGPLGKEGFLFYGGHNEPVYQSAPGLLGLIEGRRVLERWKPRIVNWLDHSEHFFDHILHEFEREDLFEPIGQEIREIRAQAATLEIKNKFLFQYLQVVAREVERSELATQSKNPAPRLRVRAAGDIPKTIPLGGLWRAHYRKASGVYQNDEMILPVNWELVPGKENYAGSVRFTRIIHVADKLRGRRLALWFHGVDYFADVWVNGHYAGGHEGFFAPFEFDISPYVRFGEDNIIRVAVSSPNEPAGNGTGVMSGWDDFSPASSFPNRKSLIKGTLGHHDAKRGGAWSSMTSQDGNTGGVWNGLELRIHNAIHFPASGIKVTTLSTTPSKSRSAAARLRFDFSIVNVSVEPAEATLHVLAQPANFKGRSHRIAQEVLLSPGTTELFFDEELSPVALWDPADRGFPHLYSIRCRIQMHGEVQDEEVVETGFRTLSVSPNGESYATNGALAVNGAEVSVRGTNLLPTYWLSEYTDELIERDFEMLREAGFNAILIHALVGPKRLYEHANRLGFIVVQQFPLQWSYEPSPNFALRAAAQIKEMAKFLYNEPCVVSYEVHNEPDLRLAADADNRFLDFELHAVLRAADPYRWATTFSGGNHAYPGQFYPLRDDNSFETLPGRFQENEFNGLAIARHRNMPTEFGIQAMPNVELFGQLLDEDRVATVLRRIREDSKWVSAAGESWAEAANTLEAAKQLLGGRSWGSTLQNFDWTLLWGLGSLNGRIREIEQQDRVEDEAANIELVSLKLAELLLDVLHYGAFKGENFWFGLWEPATTLEGFVDSSQNRQYRMHKHAIETFLNAAATGPLLGYFSFMFIDPDIQAPTWGVVDAAGVPKKAYRAYIESNQRIRASLPYALRRTVKLPGDSWFRAAETETQWQDEPWAGAELIVMNDTDARLEGALVTISLENEQSQEMPFADLSGRKQSGWRLTIGVEPHSGRCFHRLAEVAEVDSVFDPIVPEDIPPGRYFLRVALRDGKKTLQLNSYEFVLPDTRFLEMESLPKEGIRQLLYGAPAGQGFHFWKDNGRGYQADKGVRGLASGFAEAEAAGIDLHEVVQGEHLFRHILNELQTVEQGRPLWRQIWNIRSEVVSPFEKSRVLVRYLQLFVEKAEQWLGEDGPAVSPLAAVTTGGRATGTRIPRR